MKRFKKSATRSCLRVNLLVSLACLLAYSAELAVVAEPSGSKGQPARKAGAQTAAKSAVKTGAKSGAKSRSPAKKTAKPLNDKKLDDRSAHYKRHIQGNLDRRKKIFEMGPRMRKIRSDAFSFKTEERKNKGTEKKTTSGAKKKGASVDTKRKGK